MTTEYAAMAGLAAACYLLRALFVVLVPASCLPQVVHRALGFLPPAVLAALVAVETETATRGASPPVAAYLLVTVVLMALAARRFGGILAAVAVAAPAVLLLDLVLLG